MLGNNLPLRHILVLPTVLFGYLSITNYIAFNHIHAVNSHSAYAQAEIKEKVNSKQAFFIAQFSAADKSSYIVRLEPVKNAGDFTVYDNTPVGGKVGIIYDAKKPYIAYLLTNIPNESKSKEISAFCGLIAALFFAGELAVLFRVDKLVSAKSNPPVKKQIRNRRKPDKLK